MFSIPERTLFGHGEHWVSMDGSFNIFHPVNGVQTSASQAVPWTVLSTVWNRDRVVVIENVRI